MRSASGPRVAGAFREAIEPQRRGATMSQDNKPNNPPVASNFLRSIIDHDLASGTYAGRADAQGSPLPRRPWRG